MLCDSIYVDHEEVRVFQNKEMQFYSFRFKILFLFVGQELIKIENYN